MPSPVIAETTTTSPPSASARSRASSTRSVFVPDDHGRPRGERRVVRAELGPQRRQVGGRVVRGEIDDQHQRATAHDVTQEPMPEALPVGGALDQPWHVGDDEPIPVAARDARGSASAS